MGEIEEKRYIAQGVSASGAPLRSEPPVVGVVGLGTMGGAIARHLLEAGYEVVGLDPRDEAVAAFTVFGGVQVSSPAAVAEEADLVILSLPTVAAFEEVTSGLVGFRTVAGPRAWVVLETSTLPLAVKELGRVRLAESSMELLDCPISGTGAQMASKDVAFYLSGESGAVASVRAVLASCSRDQFDVGPFGNGTKMKLVANHLVAIHNASAAEALVLATRAGLDPAIALRALLAGAGTSRMLEMRGPMMVARDYAPATMKVRTFQKDLDIITAFAREFECPLPVFTAAAQLNLAALAEGHDEEDTASVYTVIERLAGIESES